MNYRVYFLLTFLLGLLLVSCSTAHYCNCG